MDEADIVRLLVDTIEAAAGGLQVLRAKARKNNRMRDFWLAGRGWREYCRLIDDKNKRAFGFDGRVARAPMARPDIVQMLEGVKSPCWNMPVIMWPLLCNW